MYINQLRVFREFSYLDPRVCIFSPIQKAKGAFPLVPAAGLFCLLSCLQSCQVLLKSPLGLHSRQQMLFFFFYNMANQRVLSSGMDNFTLFQCKIFLLHSVFAQTSPPPPILSFSAA